MVRRPLGPIFSAPIVKGEQPFGIHELARRIREALAKSPTKLTEVFGVGPVLAAKIIGRIVNAAHFPTKAHFASYTGTAPVEVSSTGVVRHRLSRAATVSSTTRRRDPRPRSRTLPVSRASRPPGASRTRPIASGRASLPANTRGRPRQRPRASVGVTPTMTGFSATLSITGTVVVTRRSSAPGHGFALSGGTADGTATGPLRHTPIRLHCRTFRGVAATLPDRRFAKKALTALRFSGQAGREGNRRSYSRSTTSRESSLPPYCATAPADRQSLASTRRATAIPSRDHA